MKQVAPSVLISALLLLPAGATNTGAQIRPNPQCKLAESRLDAQTKAPPQPAENTMTEEIRQEVIARIIGILRVTADGSKDWQDTLAAVRVQAQTADLSWESDTEGARRYLVQAWQTANTVRDSQTSAKIRNESPKNEARREVLLVARRRAPELAKRWLEEMSQEADSDEKDRKRGAFDDRTRRSAVLLDMAAASVTNNPQVTAELAIDSLQDGISFGLQYVLLNLHEKDFDLAQGVFRAALRRLRSSGLLDPNELLVLYSYVFTPGRVFAANTEDDPGRRQLGVTRNPIRITAAGDLNPALGIDFLNLAADLLINAPLPAKGEDLQLAARQQISTIGVLSPRMSEILPARAAELDTRAQKLEAIANFSTSPAPPLSDIPTVYPHKGESKEDLAARQVDALVEKAEKETDVLAQNILYARAAIATMPGTYSRGWALAGKISDKRLKEDVTNYLSYRAAVHFAIAGQFAKAHELCLTNNDPAQRAVSLIVTAQILTKAKNTALASQYLQEARSLVTGAEPNEEWTHIALGLVSSYAEFDNAAALVTLADVVKLLN